MQHKQKNSCHSFCTAHCVLWENWNWEGKQHPSLTRKSFSVCAAQRPSSHHGKQKLRLLLHGNNSVQQRVSQSLLLGQLSGFVVIVNSAQFHFPCENIIFLSLGKRHLQRICYTSAAYLLHVCCTSAVHVLLGLCFLSAVLWICWVCAAHHHCDCCTSTMFLLCLLCIQCMSAGSTLCLLCVF